MVKYYHNTILRKVSILTAQLFRNTTANKFEIPKTLIKTLKVV